MFNISIILQYNIRIFGPLSQAFFCIFFNYFWIIFSNNKYNKNHQKRNANNSYKDYKKKTVFHHDPALYF